MTFSRLNCLSRLHWYDNDPRIPSAYMFMYLFLIYISEEPTYRTDQYLLETLEIYINRVIEESELTLVDLCPCTFHCYCQTLTSTILNSFASYTFRDGGVEL